VQLPDGQVLTDWLWLIQPDAAIIIARDEDGLFLCFRQTKYAVEGPTLAPVGGMVDPGEEPLHAAQRELLEETGYEAARWERVGSFIRDPNRGGGTTHVFLAEGAHRVQEADADDLEDQQLLLLTRTQLEDALNTGELKIMSWALAVVLALRTLDRSAGK
jgi:ADP-ribose pyrophosphatase